jgi:arsenate reductase
MKIYHNPRCSKSRQTLSIIEEAGISPEIVLYLETPPSKAELRGILEKLGLSARDILRKSEGAYKSEQLSNTELTDEQLLDAMLRFPKLIERPIVVKGNKAVIGRPPENVQQLIG